MTANEAVREPFLQLVNVDAEHFANGLALEAINRAQRECARGARRDPAIESDTVN